MFPYDEYIPGIYVVLLEKTRFAELLRIILMYQERASEPLNVNVPLLR